MIDAIARVGTLVLAESLPEGFREYAGVLPADRQALGALIESPGASQTLVLVFEYDHPHFLTHYVEDCHNDKPLRYLYRHGPPNGPLALPYGQITGRLKDGERAAGELVKVVKNRLVGWASGFQKEAERYRGTLSEPEIAWLLELAQEIENRQHELSKVVDQVQSNTPTKINLFLSLAFREAERDLPDLTLGDCSLPFARLFLARNRTRVLGDHERQAICSLCGESGPVSTRGSDLFPFATFDQPTYVAGGMIRKDAWRSFALCANCYQAADQGRRYVETNLTRRVGVGRSSLSHWIVPSLMRPASATDDERDLIPLLRRQTGVGRKLSTAERKVLLANEDDLLYDLRELSDYISLSLVFIEKLKARERILLTIDDVLPSRLRHLFLIKDQVDRRAHQLGYLPEQWEFTLSRHLFQLCEINRGGDKSDLRRPEFLAILDHMFRGVPLEASYLANIFVGPLRTSFVAWRSESNSDTANEQKFRDSTRAAWLTWHFLDGLGIIQQREESDRMSSLGPDLMRPSGPYFEWLEEFFAASPRTFRGDAARVAFLLGGLTDSVREVQLKRLESAPFGKYLKSLKMEQRDLLELLPKITQKLTEYEEYKGRNRQILEAASYYTIRAGLESWSLTSAEINLIFGMGMNLGFLIRRGPGKTGDGTTDPSDSPAHNSDNDSK